MPDDQSRQQHPCPDSSPAISELSFTALVQQQDATQLFDSRAESGFDLVLPAQKAPMCVAVRAFDHRYIPAFSILRI